MTIRRQERHLMEVEGIVTPEATVVVIATEDITVHGVAKRDPHDKHVPEIGYELALGRALTALGNRMQKRARGKIKHAEDVHDAQVLAAEARLRAALPENRGSTRAGEVRLRTAVNARLRRVRRGSGR